MSPQTFLLRLGHTVALQTPAGGPWRNAWQSNAKQYFFLGWPVTWDSKLDTGVMIIEPDPNPPKIAIPETTAQA